MTQTSQPLILVVSADVAKFAGLAATMDVATTAAMAQMNLHGARLLGQQYDAVLVDETVGALSGCDMVQSLRQLRLHEGEFYLVAPPTSSLNVAHAMQAGANLVGADHHSLVAMVAKLGSPDADAIPSVASHLPDPTLRRPQFPEASFLPEVIHAMREFLASEAEPRVKLLYQDMQEKKYPNGVSFDELVSEAARHLLDDLDDRRSFVLYARSQRGQNR